MVAALLRPSIMQVHKVLIGIEAIDAFKWRAHQGYVDD